MNVFKDPTDLINQFIFGLSEFPASKMKDPIPCLTWNSIEKVDNKIIDWDEILGSTYLCKFYNIQHLLKKFVSENNIELTLPMISFGFHSSSFFCSDSRVQRRCDNSLPFDWKNLQSEKKYKKQ